MQNGLLLNVIFFRRAWSRIVGVRWRGGLHHDHATANGGDAAAPHASTIEDRATKFLTHREDRRRFGFYIVRISARRACQVLLDRRELLFEVVVLLHPSGA